MEDATAEAAQTAIPDKNSEAWRHECEARAILALPTPAVRNRRLSQIEKARGAAVREQLERTVHSLRDRQIAAGRAALKQIKSLVQQR